MKPGSQAVVIFAFGTAHGIPGGERSMVDNSTLNLETRQWRRRFLRRPVFRLVEPRLGTVRYLAEATIYATNRMSWEQASAQRSSLT